MLDASYRLCLGQQPGLGQHLLDLFVTLVAEEDLARLLVDRVVAGTEIRFASSLVIGSLAIRAGRGSFVDLTVQLELSSAGPEMISGVRASSIRIESTRRPRRRPGAGTLRGMRTPCCRAGSRNRIRCWCRR